MPHTDKSTVVAQYIFNLITTNKVALGLDNVLYGDQNEITPGKVAVVATGRKDRTLARVAFPGAGTLNRMIILVTIYNNTVGGEATKSLETDQLAEAVEHLLHQNTTMGGNIIHGFVETFDPGYNFRRGSMFRATQLVFVGQTKTNLTDIP